MGSASAVRQHGGLAALTRNTAAWVAITLTGLSTPCWGAVYSDTTDLNLAKSRALPYIAKNGGPAVIVEFYKGDGTFINYMSGSLLTSPDGKNRTVATVAHGWTAALAADPNPYALVVTGTNRVTDRGSELRASEVRLAPGADGSLNTPDLAALLLPTDVPNTGQFVISSASLGTELTAIGTGFVLTQSQLRDGTYAQPDGGYARFEGHLNTGAFGGGLVNDTYFDTSVFQVGQYPYGGVAASGNSGSGVFIDSSFQFDTSGSIAYAEYVGTIGGYGGDRLSTISGSVYTTASYAQTYQFLNDAIAVPEPSTLGLMGLCYALLLKRQRRKGMK